MENIEVGSFADSPLKPLRNRLSLLKALGLPLRIEDEDATVVKNKKTWICFAIFFSIWAVSSALGMIAFSVMSYHSNEIWNIQETLYNKNGISKWAATVEWIFYSIIMCQQYIYLLFYHRLGAKFEKFIKDYQCFSMKLGHGEVRTFWVMY